MKSKFYGGNKMKVKNLIKLLPALVLGIAITGNVLANDHRDYHKSIKAEKVFTLRPSNFVSGPNMTFNEDRIMDLEQMMNRISQVRVSFETGGTPGLVINFEPNDVSDLEDWMFEQDYLSEEKTPGIEDWMMDTNYIESKTAPVESWMLDNDYLGSEATRLESWMLDNDYLESAATPVESWMLEGNYLETESLTIESWMSDPGYLQGDSYGIECWMTDPGYLK